MAANGKSALVTGAGKNIGRACVLGLAEDGFNVAINGSSDRAACDGVAKEAAQFGVKTLVIMGDVGKPEECKRIAGEAIQAFGAVDALLNNAALRPNKPFLEMTDAEWDGLLIPINLAFFFQNSSDLRVSALYPSPAGATESLLPLEAWSSICQANPVLNQLEADVEALLVNRVGHARGAAAAEYYIVPIDACYKLVGLIRIHWRGLSGGTEVWQEIVKFFAELRAAAQIVTEELHA